MSNDNTAINLTWTDAAMVELCRARGSVAGAMALINRSEAYETCEDVGNAYSILCTLEDQIKAAFQAIDEGLVRDRALLNAAPISDQAH